VTQSQFAGYYVAKAKGFYEAEGLDVTIVPGGPTTPVPQQMSSVDVGVEWAGNALIAREKGIKMVNIAQPFKNGGLELICPKDGPVQSEKDFPGHTLGVWFYGNEVPFFAWMHKLGYSTEGGPDGVTVLQQNFDVSALVQGQADCISVMTYNELGQAADAGFTADKIIQFNYSDMGNALLEDGLWVLEERLADPKFKENMVKFVRASMKGWDYALANPDEAAQIVVDADDAGAATFEHERYMVGEVAKLMAGANGVLDKSTWDRTVQALLDQKVLTAAPDSGAFTTEITDAAFK
jgi:NitT/TauT family transport system substrate-binding protein